MKMIQKGMDVKNLRVNYIQIYGGTRAYYCSSLKLSLSCLNR